MGAMQGFGPMVRDEAVFHSPWERRAFAMAQTALIVGNTDDFRHAIERLDPAQYLTLGYYGRWLANVEVRLSERGLLDSDEIDARCGSTLARPRSSPSRGLPAGRSRGRGPRRHLARAAAFDIGDPVRVRDLHPLGHTRLPGYVRGHQGVVTFVHPAFVFPDTNAHGEGEHPQHLYGVRFQAAELWGRGEHLVTVDLFEPYLEATA